MSLGKTIKVLRVSAGLKQKDLAKKVGVSANYLSLIENEKREPSISFLKDLAGAIDVPLGILFLDLESNANDMSPEEKLIFRRIKDLVWEIEQIRVARKSPDE